MFNGGFFPGRRRIFAARQNSCYSQVCYQQQPQYRCQPQIKPVQSRTNNASCSNSVANTNARVANNSVFNPNNYMVTRDSAGYYHYYKKPTDEEVRQNGGSMMWKELSREEYDRLRAGTKPIENIKEATQQTQTTSTTSETNNGLNPDAQTETVQGNNDKNDENKDGRADNDGWQAVPNWQPVKQEEENSGEVRQPVAKKDDSAETRTDLPQDETGVQDVEDSQDLNNDDGGIGDIVQPDSDDTEASVQPDGEETQESQQDVGKTDNDDISDEVGIVVIGEPEETIPLQDDEEQPEEVVENSHEEVTEAGNAEEAAEEEVSQEDPAPVDGQKENVEQINGSQLALYAVDRSLSLSEGGVGQLTPDALKTFQAIDPNDLQGDELEQYQKFNEAIAPYVIKNKINENNERMAAIQRDLVSPNIAASSAFAVQQTNQLRLLQLQNQILQNPNLDPTQAVYRGKVNEFELMQNGFTQTAVSVKAGATSKPASDQTAGKTDTKTPQDLSAQIADINTQIDDLRQQYHGGFIGISNFDIQCQRGEILKNINQLAQQRMQLEQQLRKPKIDNRY